MKSEAEIGKNTFTSVLVMGCTLISRILGFVRIIVITTFFSREKADIINLAFSVPNNLRKLLAEGALSSAFIPVLSRNLIDTPDGSKAKPLVGSILTLQLLVIVPLCVLCIVFSDFLVERVLSELRDPLALASASRLFRWVIGYLLLISISAVFMGVLNTHRYFVVPAATPLLFSIAVIACVTYLRGRLDIYAMAAGVLIGGAGQIVFQYPLFHRLGYRFTFRLDVANPEFRRIMKRWLPILATSSIFTATQLIAIRFASGLESGSVTVVSIALVFFQLPFGIFSASITNVLFPRMSSQAGRNDLTGLKESIQYGLRFLSVALVPSAVFLCLMSTQLISVGFLKGEFTYENVLLGSPVLIYYAVGLLSVGCFTFLQRVLYSLHEYRAPLVIAVILAGTDIFLSLWLKETPLRAGGIALANSISFTLGAVLLLRSVYRKIGSLGGKKITLTAVKAAASALPAGGLLVVFNLLLDDWWLAGRRLSGFLLVFAAAALFSGIILLGYHFTKVEMLADLLARFKRRDT